MSGSPLVLVTGATGYVGGRLVPELLRAGYRVRALARHPERLGGQPWRDEVEVVRGDALDEDAVRAALDGVDVAYYLIHSLASGPRFEALDREAARLFAREARDARVGRIVYLGGLHPDEATLSPHMRSRREVGEIFLASGVPTTVLRAAVILGSGSASFEMLRYLTERLPAMITPRWVRNRIQPIAVRDVLRYLVGVAALPPHVSRAFDIGGPDVLTYTDMMQRYAAVAGLGRRVILPLNVLSPGLSAHWVGLVTPVPHRIAKPLVESLVHEVVATDDDIRAWVPDPPEGRLGFDRAVELALQRVKEATVLTRWSSASLPGTPSDPLPSDPEWAGGSLYVDERATPVRASPEHLWSVIQGIGGENGWYSWPLAWSVRGWLDRFSGGPGLTRGRRDPARVTVGDALDWWRVEEVQELRLLRLRAEMKVPGMAWLELRVEQDPVGRTLFRQRAVFHPRGLPGEAYWLAVLPFHAFVFGGMQQNVALAAERLERERAAEPQRAVSQQAA
ncbi:SDR family oxidoreductase [Aquipuribacter nitratireducens]|uniref:SDR family oxidoreductase n=1 Tax=Aquipuribacter nitratireducens TaxID=650104 RepID=A0ABW0GMB3_9MICO